MKVRFRPPVEYVRGLRKKGGNLWSILETRRMSPNINQFTSGLLHSVLHLRIYDIKHVYGFVRYIGNFSSQQKVGKIYFSSDLFYW